MKMQWRWLAALAIVMLAGCAANREAQLVGKWKVDMTSLKMPQAQGKAAMGQEMAKGMLAGIKLELKADKSFDMLMMMPLSGTWKIDETANTVALTITKMNNQDISKMGDVANNKPMVLDIASDNSHLTAQNSPGAKTPRATFAFVKE